MKHETFILRNHFDFTPFELVQTKYKLKGHRLYPFVLIKKNLHMYAESSWKFNVIFIIYS